MSNASNQRSPHTDPSPRALSARERGIVLDLAHGRTIKQIAQDLHLTYQGVAQNLLRARAKLNACTTFHLVYLVIVDEIEKNQETQYAQPAFPSHPSKTKTTRITRS